jgi:predicted hotdog family 3-hydroxylacyl-ACP dehydratase
MLSTAVAVEYAAQAAAIHNGLLNAEKKEKLNGGLLAGVSNLEMHVDRLDNIAGSLQMKVKKLIADTERALYQFDLFSGGKQLSSGRVSVVFESAFK